MAQVDFSNAVLDVYPYGDRKPFYSLDLGLGNKNIYDFSGNVINTNSNISTLVNTPGRRTYIYTGAFTTSGTKAALGYNGANYWQITNISFSAGDTYSFVVEINASGNAGG